MAKERLLNFPYPSIVVCLTRVHCAGKMFLVFTQRRLFLLLFVELVRPRQILSQTLERGVFSLQFELFPHRPTLLKQANSYRGRQKCSTHHLRNFLAL